MQTDHLLLIVTALAAVVPWAMSIHAKVSSIAASMEGLPEIVHDTQVRLERHEQEIKTLQKATAAGH